MLINIKKKFKTLDGQTLLEGTREIDLGFIFANVLLMKDENATGEELFLRYNLANVIFNSKNEEIDISIENLAMLKSLIGKFYKMPIIAGQAWEMLEGK